MFARSARGGRTEDDKRRSVLRLRAEIAAKSSAKKTPYWQDVHNRFQMSIPLKAQDKPVELGPEFHNAMRRQYASMYLQRLGAFTTEANIRHVLREAPLSHAKVAAGWKARGATRDAVVILPHPEHRETERRAAAAAAAEADTGREDDGEASPPPAPAPPLSDEEPLVMGNTKTSFEHLKRRYVFPFNAVPSSVESSVEGVLPVLPDGAAMPRQSSFRRASLGLLKGASGGNWLQAAAGAAKAAMSLDPLVRMRKDALAQLYRPLRVSPKEVSIVQSDFSRWFPLDQLPVTPAQRPVIRELLSSLPMTRLVGLLAHHAYWHILRVCTGDGATLPVGDDNRLTAAIFKTFGMLEMELQFHKPHLSLFRSLVLFCLRVAVEALLRAEYPLWFEYEATALASTAPTAAPPPTDAPGHLVPGLSAKYVPVLARLDDTVAAFLDPSRLGSSLPAFELGAEGVSVAHEARTLATNPQSQARHAARSDRRAGSGAASPLRVPVPPSAATKVAVAATRSLAKPRDLYAATSTYVSALYPDLHARSGAGTAPVPAALSAEYKGRLQAFALQRLQTHYLASGTPAAMERMDILQRLSEPLPSTRAAGPLRASGRAVVAAPHVEKGKEALAPPTTYDEVAAKLQADSEAFLAALEERSWKYRSPFDPVA